jgi:hypothetical protein
MARAHRKGSRKARAHRKTTHRRSSRMRGGQAPVNYANPGPMNLSLAQGKQFDAYHASQHGGAVAYGPYPGAVTEPSMLPANLVGPAHLLPLNAAFAEIRQFGPESDLKGGARRRSRKNRKSSKSRKARKGSRKAHRKQRGGVLVRWGGGSRKSRKGSRKSRKGGRKAYKGGAYAELRFPMPVGDETKMLIPPQLQAQAGLNPEWKLAENPLSFAPKY